MSVGVWKNPTKQEILRAAYAIAACWKLKKAHNPFIEISGKAKKRVVKNMIFCCCYLFFRPKRENPPNWAKENIISALQALFAYLAYFDELSVKINYSRRQAWQGYGQINQMFP